MMQFELKDPAVLLLEDGTVFYGRGCGFKGTATGEICFTTGMTGYQEVFTDPSFKGQVVVTTHVHIGNYGIKHGESESGQVQIAGLVCKQFMEYSSRHQADDSLQAYFEEHKIVAISDVDTRSVVRHIRNKGAMNCIFSSETTDIELLKEKLQKVPSMKGLELSSSVTTPTPYFSGNPNARYRVAVIDLGMKHNIVQCLNDRNCYCQVFPMQTSVEDMEAWQPDGYMISNGPGDPEPLKAVIASVKRLVKANKKIFGICLGHQVLCWAMGIPTYKMFNGHRGANHPVKNLATGKCEITSQNHGFVADEKTLENHPVVEITHKHVNDGTVAGIHVKGKPVFSVQYHPEASAGPHDSRYLFDEFIAFLKAGT